MAQRVLVTGIGGQDGSYLAEMLLARGDTVFGLVLPDAPDPPVWLEPLARQPEYAPRLILLEGNLQNPSLFVEVLCASQPEEIYHLAAVSGVARSFSQPLPAAEVNGVGALRLLEAARLLCRHARIFLAGSGEMFGPTSAPADETTPCRPVSPYAASKLLAYWAGVNYRESYGMFVCNGILFNHESPRRPPRFLSRKVARAAVEIAAGRRRQVALGNLSPRRDWGYAPEFMEAAAAVLAAPRPDDYVIATGQSHSVEEFVAGAFAAVGLDYRDHVTLDPALLRPSDAEAMCGNPARIESELGWRARTGFQDLVALMVQAERHQLEARP